MVSQNLVLIPGLLCTEALYTAQIGGLSDVANVTVAGHRDAGTMAGLAASILRTAPERFALAGLSMGGYIAFEIMRQAPDRVERLALLDTSARPDLPEQSENRKRLVALAEKKGVGAAAREMFAKLVSPANAEDETLKAAFIEMAEATGVTGFANQQAAITGRADSRATLAQITCPTLVLVGDEDQLTPPEVAREIASGIAGSTFTLVLDSGHLSTMEAPGAVTNELRLWLAETRQS